MQDDTRGRRDEAGAETIEDGVDEAYRIPISVHDRDIDCVAMKGHFEGWQVGQRLSQVDHTRKPVGQFVGQQMVNRDVRLFRISDPRVAGGIGKARCFYLDMQPVGRLRVPLCLEAAQDVEDQERNDTLAIRRTFVDRVAAKISGHWGHILAARIREVFQRVKAAQRAQVGGHVLGHWPLVEASPPVGGYAFEGFREFGLSMNLTDFRRSPCRKEYPRCRRVRCQQLFRQRPVTMNTGVMA